MFSIQEAVTTQKVFVSFIILLLTFWSFPVVACGCGVLVMGADTQQGWEYGDDTTEHAFITYNDGIEHLLINLEIKTRDTGAVLVTPIPAPPQETVSDILAETPSFNGYNVVDQAVENIDNIRGVLVSTQLYPIPLMVLGTLSMGVTTDAPDAIPLLDTWGNQGIEVYQHIEKEGMVAEVLTAETSDALYTYLQSKGLRVEKDAIPIFRDYIRSDFSFVVAWIDPTKKHLTAKGISVAFPTDEIFYPLKPNSAYTGKGKDKTLTVVGYTSPLLYEGIAEDTVVEYEYSKEGLTYEDFIDTEDGFGYTKITIKADPENMQEDLYISRIAPLRIYFAHGINMHPLLFGLVLLLIVAYLATLLALQLTKPGHKLNKQHSLLKMVVANCFTLIGTIVGAKLLLDTKRFKYVAVFSMLFLVFTLLFTYMSMYFITA